MKDLSSEETTAHSQPNFLPEEISQPTTMGMSTKSHEWTKVIAGGRIVRLDSDKPYLERMVTGNSNVSQDITKTTDALEAKSKEEAIMESVASNLEAGIQMVDHQETALAKIGGKLSEIALCLNRVRNPKATMEMKEAAQESLEEAQQKISDLSQKTFDHVALFSNGPSKPLTIAVPTLNEWEGLSVERSNLAQPGLQTLKAGKVFGNKPGIFLDHGSIKRAFAEWRQLCIQNRLQWGLLIDRLQGVCRTLVKIKEGKTWNLPRFPKDPKLGPLRRPHRNN